MIARHLALLLAAVAPAAFAQPLVVSPAPERVSVSLYRDPDRGPGDEMNLNWLEGFALVSETRTISLPAGPSEIRFEGVAGGILPVSAIVTGLPGGAAEKNRDARLLSPGALIDAALGRRVHIRRTSRATGAVSEVEAVIRSGPDGVVLETAEGIEALDCSGLPERLVYDAVPAGLSDRPTLAVRTITPVAATATVTLSYLASEFDWDANYVAAMARDGQSLDLFAWLTLANGNDESFADAGVQAVAGTLNREERNALDDPRPVSPTISLRCWPRGTTSDGGYPPPPPPPMLGGGGGGGGGEYDEIIVTGSRIRERLLESATPITVITASQEELGDLKLYRIPEPVTVAAHAQKQVALLRRTGVKFERLYEARINADTARDPEPTQMLLRMRNETGRGLGLPLPAGGVALFETFEGRQMLVGESRIVDKAVGEEVEIVVGDSAEVQVAQRMLEEKTRPDPEDLENPVWTRRRYEVVLTNANPRPVIVETRLQVFGDYEIVRPSRRLAIKDGRRLWRVRVKANSRAVLTYELARTPDPPEVEDEDDD